MRCSRALARVVGLAAAFAACDDADAPSAPPGGAGAGGAQGTSSAGGGGGAEAAPCPLETGEPPRVVSISGDEDLTIALLSDGSVVCWGMDPYLQCGTNHWHDPPSYARGPRCLVSAEVGTFMSAGVGADGRVQVWGDERAGEAGDGAGSGPAWGTSSVVKLPRPALAVAPGIPMLALLTGGGLYAWGDVYVGDMRWAAQDVPVPYPFPDAVAALGQFADCFLTASGEVHCYGPAGGGLLGPDVVDGGYHSQWIALRGVTALSQAYRHACVVNLSGEVWCWGDNLFGAMGLPWPEVKVHPDPVRVEGIPPVVDVFAGDGGTCAITASGAAWCWTVNDMFSADGSIPPTPFVPAFRFTDIVIGSSHACGLLDDGRVYCVGSTFGCSTYLNEHAVPPCFIPIEHAERFGTDGDQDQQRGP